MTPYASTVLLPDIRLELSARVPARELLLVAGGRAPSAAWLREAARSRTVVAVDRGLDACRAAGLVPARLVGDGDSASPESWAWAEKQCVPVSRFPTDKDLTDTELALDEIGAGSFVVLTGAFGGRFDHAYSALYSFIASGCPGCIADDGELLLVLRDRSAARLEPVRTPKAISLLPLTDVCEDVSISGVHWPLSGARLERLRPYAVSNRLEPPERAFAVENGAGLLGVYICWDEELLRRC